MTYYYFSKFKSIWNEEFIVVFEPGCIGKPTCILDKNAIERLKEEWKRKEERGEGKK